MSATANQEPYEHLRPSSAKVAALDDASRIEFINSDHWVGYTRAREAVAKLERLYQWPRKNRMPNLLLVGETNQGKSMILERFCRIHRSEIGLNAERVKVVHMLMPGIPTVPSFLAKLLKTVNAPHRPRASAGELEQIAVDVLLRCGAQILVIDEIHNILAGPPRARHEFLNVLRGLGNQVRIPIVGSGTFDAYLAIRSDPQLENRFEPFILPRWEVNDESLSLLKSFSEILPLRRPSRIASTTMAGYLLQRSHGNLGELTGLLSRAAEVAIEKGEECINQRVLAATQYDGPPERRNSLTRFTRQM